MKSRQISCLNFASKILFGTGLLMAWGAPPVAHAATMDGGIIRDTMLTTPNQNYGAAFGGAVSISNDGLTAVVGAPSYGDAGAAFVWVRTSKGALWELDTILSDVNTLGARQGSSVALYGNGNTLLIGGPGDTTGGRGTDTLGGVWVWQKQMGTWYLEKKLAPLLNSRSGSNSNIEFGYSIALAPTSGGILALIGAPGDGGDVGSARMWFRRSSDAKWIAGARLFGDSADGESRQGESVALSPDGNFAAVGGPRDKGFVAHNKGAVWVWRKGKGPYDWAPVGASPAGKLSVPEIANMRQGASVAFSNSGSVLLVGGPDDGGNGAAWVWVSNGKQWPTWRLSRKLTVDSPRTSLGAAVALTSDGKLALAGGYHANSDTGAIWLWSVADSAPAFKVQMKVANDQQGYSVAISGDGSAMAVGGPRNEIVGGRAWLVDFMPRTEYQVLSFRNGPSSTTPTPQYVSNDWSQGYFKIGCPTPRQATGLGIVPMYEGGIVSLLCNLPAGGQIGASSCISMNHTQQSADGRVICPAGKFVTGISRAQSDQSMGDLLCCTPPGSDPVVGGSVEELGPLDPTVGVDFKESVLPLGDWSPKDVTATCGPGRQIAGVRLDASWPYVRSIFCATAVAPGQSASVPASVPVSTAPKTGVPPTDTILEFGRVNTLPSPNAAAFDWSGGNYKAACTQNRELIGISLNQYNPNTGVHKVMCGAGANKTGIIDPGLTCRNVPFGQAPIIQAGTTGYKPSPDNWDVYYNKSNCAENEFVAGISQDGSGVYQSALCCSSSEIPHPHTNLNKVAFPSDPTKGFFSYAGSGGSVGRPEGLAYPDWDPSITVNGYFGRTTIVYPKIACGAGRYIVGVSREPIVTSSPPAFGFVHAIQCAGDPLP